jgi:hypothetical protein
LATSDQPAATPASWWTVTYHDASPPGHCAQTDLEAADRDHAIWDVATGFNDQASGGMHFVAAEPSAVAPDPRIYMLRQVPCTHPHIPDDPDYDP